MATPASQKLAAAARQLDLPGGAANWRKVWASVAGVVGSPSMLLVLPLLFYLAMPTRNFYWDGVAFAINIEKGLPAADLLHPNHLAYSLAGSWIYRLSEMAGIHARALFVLQFVNAVLAGLCVPLIYCCLRLRNVAPELSVPAALVFAFSATWWRFAADVNAYVPSIFFLLGAYVLIERRKPVVLAGLLQCGALLCHQLAILFVPVAILHLRRNRASMLVFAAAALVPVAVAYVAAHGVISNVHPGPGLFSWMVSHSPDSGFYFNPLTDAAVSIRGVLRLWFGGKLGDFVGDGVSQAALAGLAAATVLFLVSLPRAFRGGAALAKPPGHLLVWAGLYSLFLFVWMPQNTFYRLFYLPALVAILATMLPGTPAVRKAAWLFVPVIFSWNFCFVAYPQSRPGFNVPLQFALAQTQRWPSGTPIVFSTFHPDLWTISYFSNQAAWIGMERVDVGDLEGKLTYARGQNTPLWLEESAYHLISATREGKQWLTLHERPGELLEFKGDKHHFRFHSVR